MHTIKVTREFAFPADKVWQLTGDFGGLQAWLPGVTACNVEGIGAADNGGNAVRSVHLLDGSITRERLETLNNETRRTVYSILEAKGLDASNAFQATFQVLPLAHERCEVHWSARFRLPEGISQEKADKALARIEQMYGFFLQHLQGVMARA